MPAPEDPAAPPAAAPPHTVAVVVPVYQGERTLDALLAELEPLVRPGRTPAGHALQVTEVVLVHDHGPDRSDETIRRLARERPWVVPVWLSRNCGQHAATLAGMASTSAEWVATLDEDGQHDPADLPRLLDAALAARAALVYAAPTNAPPHGPLRNLASAVVKALAGGGALAAAGRFNSYRLVLGEVARGLAAYCGDQVYLDVGLGWVVDRTAYCPVALRPERGRPSGYTLRRLASHFWHLVLTSGTRPLRLVSALGALCGLAAFALGVWVVWARLTAQVPVAGWSSVMVTVLAVGGANLFVLGVIAEYLGIVVRMALGKPAYLVVTDPAAGPRGRPRPGAEA